MDITDSLQALRGEGRYPWERITVLIKAARAGLITELACAMPDCVCPQGRAYFTRRHQPPNGPWGPSADRWPIAGRDGGLYRFDNVRLAHRFCNQRYSGQHNGMRRGYSYVGQPKTLSPAERERRRQHGRMLGAMARTPEGRARSRENGRLYGSLGGSLGGPARARRASTPEGRAALLQLLEKGRQTSEQLRANAAKANCVRWAIGRHHLCVCGEHV